MNDVRVYRMPDGQTVTNSQIFKAVDVIRELADADALIDACRRRFDDAVMAKERLFESAFEGES